MGSNATRTVLQQQHLYMPGSLCKMAVTRIVLMACLLAVLSKDRTAADSEMPAFVGDNVILPCPCSYTTVEVVWQIGTIVVNHYTTLPKKINEPHDSYKSRSHLFLPNQKGNCSLLLLKVSESDQKNYTCYTFNEDRAMNENHVHLTISRRITAESTKTPAFTSSKDMFQGEVTVGVPITLVAGGILVMIVSGILLMRRRRQRIQRMEMNLDPTAGFRIMEHSPV